MRTTIAIIADLPKENQASIKHMIGMELSATINSDGEAIVDSIHFDSGPGIIRLNPREYLTIGTPKPENIGQDKRTKI